jgi:hypothetical protein
MLLCFGGGGERVGGDGTAHDSAVHHDGSDQGGGGAIADIIIYEYGVWRC